jgi:hypothetical protein
MNELKEAVIKCTQAFRSFSKVIRRSGIEVKEFRLPRKQKKAFKKEINRY